MVADGFAPFHFGDVVHEPGQEPPTPEQILRDGSLLVGSVDTVTRQFETLITQTPVEWIFA